MPLVLKSDLNNVTLHFMFYFYVKEITLFS